MKIVRFGPKGAEKPGLLISDKVVDLRRHFPDIPDVGPEFFAQGWIQRLQGKDLPGEVFSERIGCPVHTAGKIICLGKNYAEHAQEGGMKIPDAPLLFCKTPNTLNGPYDPILMPVSSGNVDWEVELAVIIGNEIKRASRKQAMNCVAGFAVMNDVSAREAQFSDKQWFRGKSFDTFAPLGPAILTPDEIPDVSELQLTAVVNGELMQSCKVSDMLFDIPAIIEYVSRDITLAPGDIISTGTPSGVGIFRDPPIVLKAGDTVECGIDPIGTLRNIVVAADPGP